MVAKQMTVGIINIFKVIGIDHKDKKRVVVPSGPIDLVIKASLEVSIVVKSGQRISDRQLL